MSSSSGVSFLFFLFLLGAPFRAATAVAKCAAAALNSSAPGVVLVLIAFRAPLAGAREP